MILIVVLVPILIKSHLQVKNSNPVLIITSSFVISEFESIPLDQIEYFQFIQLQRTGMSPTDNLLKIGVKQRKLSLIIDLNDLNYSVSETKNIVRKFLNRKNIKEFQQVDKLTVFTNYKKLYENEL